MGKIRIHRHDDLGLAVKFSFADENIFSGRIDCNDGPGIFIHKLDTQAGLLQCRADFIIFSQFFIEIKKNIIKHICIFKDIFRLLADA